MSKSTDTSGFIDGLTEDFDGELTAFDIIDLLGWDLDFMANATQVKWKAYFTQRAYDLVKADPDDYFYTKNGVEYVKVFDNDVIPFIIHFRVAGIDESIPEYLGCRREVDAG